ADRRRQIIAITETGEADLDEHRARRLHRQRALYSDLSDAEQEELIRILRKLHESWQKFPPQGQSDGCRCQKAAETGNGQSLSNPGANQSSKNPDHLQNLQSTDSGQPPADTDNAQILPDTGSGQTLTNTDKSPRLPAADSDQESPVIGQGQRSPNVDNHEHTEAQKV
ncbi:MAG: MarR family winged helix-turn-helix transcriptional regulator, partial [Lachnospiraceae bacterium]|nr:MarR family winged helix-turn-helix transcriptional regulator [Lachnospiraceae bacterium]